MAIVVETGSIVTGANSYVTRSDYLAYALSLGITISDVAAADVQLIKAAQFIDSKEANLKGCRVDRDQPLAFPRHAVVIDGFEWLYTEIPRQVILCQMALALDINAGIDLYNPTPILTKKRAKVEGAVEVEYFGADGAVKLSRDSTSTALLNCLMVRGGLYSVALVRA